MDTRGGFPWRSYLLLAAAMLGVQALGAARPWAGAYDWNGAAWSTAARNLLRHPLSVTRGGVYPYHHAPQAPPPAGCYVHHPPLIVWLTAAALWVGQESEAAARAAPMLAGLVGLAALMAWLAGRAGGAAALAGGVCFALCPTQLYYGKMPNHEPLCLAFLLIAAWRAERWRTRPTFANASGCAAAVFLACWSGWPGYLFALALGVGSLEAHATRRWSLFVAVGGAAGLALLLFVAHLLALRPDGLRDLQAAFMQRSAWGGPAHAPLGAWCWTIFRATWQGLSPVGVAALLLGLGLLARRRGALALAPLAAAGFGNVLLFRQGAFIHEYYTHYLCGFAAAAAGLAWASWPAARPLAFGLLAAHLLHAAVAVEGLLAQQTAFFNPRLPESREFVRSVGAALRQLVPEGMAVAVNSPPHGEQLAWYADRPMVSSHEVPKSAVAKWLDEKLAAGAALCVEASSRHAAELSAAAAARGLAPLHFAIEGHEFKLYLPPR